MIKLEHIVLASPEQMEFIIEGMRNPMNSWGKVIVVVELQPEIPTFNRTTIISLEPMMLLSCSV